ncbi:MAG: SDR family oxidoreductase [Anaerolineae bacterium]|nr:SDR family oxidoreductase [Anaerolineae bacterium]
MQQSLQDRVALVTGSAHRVGKAIAMALAAEGVHLVVHYSGAEAEARETVREIKSLGVQAISFRADQADPAQVSALFDAIREAFGRLDILVNSAGMFKKTDFLELSYEEWQRVLAVNLTGPFLCSQQAARLMLAQDPPGGVIINIIDNSALQPWPDFPHHSVSKAGVLMLTRLLARRLAPAIRTNAIAPGPVLKEPGRTDESWAQVAARVPLQRNGTPEDVGRAVVYLAREDFLNGVVLNVDGGEHLTDSGSPLKPRAAG